jgi:thiol-disulfide isomerase/thioredoxin
MAIPMKRPRRLIVGLGLALVAGVWLGRAPLQEWIRNRATLANDAPAPEVVSDMIEQSANPRAALLAAWHSGKITHREVAIRSLHTVFPSNQLLPAEFESIALAGALDPDLNVRETAFGLLLSREHPALMALAAEQLKDPDPQVRLMGLDHLRQAPAAVGIPITAARLNEPDFAVLGLSVKLLENWSGENFGVKLADSAQEENQSTGLMEFREDGVARTRAAAEKASAWWSEHQHQFPPVALPVPAAVFATLKPLPAPDFELSTLEGRRVRLSDFRGKVVILNFWTTWCSACVGEIPALVALQKSRGDQLVILGVSLDLVPDSHGHIGGHPAVGEPAKGQGDQEDHKHDSPVVQRVREKVARTVKARGINYPVVLDETNDVGGRYNGAELPTTVIVDAQGNVRRRFVGARRLAVFEAMVDEAALVTYPESSNRAASR